MQPLSTTATIRGEDPRSFALSILLSSHDLPVKSEPRRKRIRLGSEEAVGDEEAYTELPRSSYVVLARRRLVLAFCESTYAPSPVDEHPQWCDDGLVPVLVTRLIKEPYGAYRIVLANVNGSVLLNASLGSDISHDLMEDVAEAISIGAGPKHNRHTWGDSETTRAQFMLRRPEGVQSTSFTLQVRVLWRKMNSYSDLALSTKFRHRHSLARFFPLGKPESSADTSPRLFYESIRSSMTGLPLSPLPPIQPMTYRLYPFQQSAVRWLLRREGVDVDEHGRTQSRIPRPALDKMPPTFKEGVDGDGNVCYYSHLYGVVATDRTAIQPDHVDIRGGILAEEMGLGKTVELIALINWHQRDLQVQQQDRAIDPHLPPAKTTLIITPRSILEQWINEVQRHAPSMKIDYYQGLKAQKGADRVDDLVQHLMTCDIVVTTYNVLSSEIHYANDVSERRSRYEKKYAARRSPLMLMSWWRVCLDEAQMVENGLSNATRLARLIPRCNAWAVSGTPVRTSVNDLLGLFEFLEYEPFCHYPTIWRRMLAGFPDMFQQIVGSITLRHSKEQVRDQLGIPPQSRLVVRVPFTHVEEQQYSNLYEDMCDECGFDRTGISLNAHGGSDSATRIVRMQAWLTRLRQTCLHPQVGHRNWRVFGRRQMLHTVDEVLDVMIDQNEAAVRLEDRRLLMSRLRRGQIFEKQGEPEKALEVWVDGLAQTDNMVAESRAQLEIEVQSSQSHVAGQAQPGELDEEDNDEQEADVDQDARVLTKQQSLRLSLELGHTCRFFMANGCYQAKIDQRLIDPDSEMYRFLDQAETMFYEKAKALRKELDVEVHAKATHFMARVAFRAERRQFQEIPVVNRIHLPGALDGWSPSEKFDRLGEALNYQANQLDEWREAIVELLLRPLVDEESAVNMEEDAYDQSIQEQTDLYAYMEALRAVVSDRHDALTGQTNNHVANSMSQILSVAQECERDSSLLIIDLLESRSSVKPKEELGSMRGITSELWSLRNSLRHQASSQHNERTQMQLALVEAQHTAAQEISAAQTRAIAGLERELRLFRSTQNARIKFYKQLQRLSDNVLPLNEDVSGSDDAMAEIIESENLQVQKLASLRSRQRYLLHLRSELRNERVDRTCLICGDTFDRGGITVCGHLYCFECIQHWWIRPRRCPQCSTKTSIGEIHYMTYKRKALEVQEDTAPRSTRMTTSLSKQSIFTSVSRTTMENIEHMEISGSYGTKIDTIARHLLWLRIHDPDAKTIIFSQFQDFLRVLEEAFQHFKIEFTSIDSRHGVQRFQTDASVEVFLLHAKAQSSGLNLVNATHVILAEPLLNTALELQAIARVHRIGQHRPTTVWQYLINGTVEEHIYELSVKRRMGHLSRVMPTTPSSSLEASQSSSSQQHQHEHQQQGDDAQHLSEMVIEAANALELELPVPVNGLMAKGHGEGEIVDEDDLWACLFNGGNDPHESSSM